MSCNLCKTIWSSKEGYKNNFCDEWDEEISIVMKQKKPWLYIPIEMDSYYSDTYLQINFCPKCGKKLI